MWWQGRKRGGFSLCQTPQRPLQRIYTAAAAPAFRLIVRWTLPSTATLSRRAAPEHLSSSVWCSLSTQRTLTVTSEVLLAPRRGIETVAMWPSKERTTEQSYHGPASSGPPPSAASRRSCELPFSITWLREAMRRKNGARRGAASRRLASRVDQSPSEVPRRSPPGAWRRAA